MLELSCGELDALSVDGRGRCFVGEADLSGLRAELLPDDVEPEVWRFARGDRIAFEQYSDLMIPRSG